MKTPSSILLQRICVYPLKGAGGVDLDATGLDSFGIPGDRRWMVAKPDGQFLSQRTHPRLALVRTFPAAAGAASIAVPESTGSSCPSFRAEAPGSGSTALTPSDEGEWLRVRVHKDRFDALVGFDEGDRWFSDFLGEPCRLVFLPEEIVRPVDPAWAPGHRVGLADGYPLHLTTEESLAALNRRLRRPTTMLHYRPNLVVSGGAAWEEDEWRVVEVGGTRVEVVKPCARCTVVTVDPESGSQGKEPLQAMKDFREWKGKVYFGQNAVVVGPGRFRVGSSVRILERGTRRPPLPPTP